MTEPERDWLTSREVAERLQVTETTLARWRDAAEGPPWYVIGKRVRYDTARFDAWLSATKDGRTA